MLNRDALDLLLARLDRNRERAGEKYELLRLKLTRFFEWRDSLSPEDLTDEVINRLARKLAAGEEIRDFTSFVYGIARNVLQEHRKELQMKTAALDELLVLSEAASGHQFEDHPTDPRIDCIESALNALSADELRLLVSYYPEADADVTSRQRRALAGKLGVRYGALRIRIHRIRAKLEQRVAECLARKKT